MAAVRLAAPPAVEATLSVQVGVVYEVAVNWVDAAGVTQPLVAYQAALSFSAGRAGDVVPAAVTNATNPVTVGRITLADTEPNMVITIPAVVTAALSFSRLRAVLDVTDVSGVPRRWMEADVVLDRGTGY